MIKDLQYLLWTVGKLLPQSADEALESPASVFALCKVDAHLNTCHCLSSMA